MTLGTLEIVQKTFVQKLPFNDLTNKEKDIKQKIFLLGLTAKNERITEFCSLYKKRNARIDKGFLYPSYCSPINKKCCYLKSPDVLDVTQNQAK